MNKVRRVFNELKKKELYYFDRITLRHCFFANKEHRESKRQYMHTFCPNQDYGAICYAKAINGLPIKHIKGLILHEIGHILADDKGMISTEKQADRMALNIFDVKVKYKDTPYGKHLQYVD